MTTGGIKLLGGGALSLAMAFVAVPRPSLLAVIPAAALMALSANAMNLFDLRPGRALKAYWLASLLLIPLFWRMPSGDLLFLGLAFNLLLLASLVYAPFDFAGMMMLGDTGANPLGAFIGLCLAQLLPVWGQGIVILLLIGLHVYAERASITKLIERVPVLQWVDRLGRSDADGQCGGRNATEGVPDGGIWG